ncbi:hypothetical protein ACIBG8_44285 [Nonomuraea sp. NPDC050556]|uniref:hypothetical protein n=1 Tax=Nonomuraea sp. NPDC050556 TaxID=3364369 RepID=UPI003795D0D3
MRTEEELGSALRQAAERAPERDLLQGLGARRRRRSRRRAQAVLAAAAVVTVMGGTAVAFSRGGGEAAAQPEPEPSAIVETTPSEGRPIEEVWPQAIFTMPAKNADGWRYRPITALSATEILLNAESSFEKAGAIEVYNTETRTARVVTKVPVTPGLKKYFPQDTAHDAANLAWYVNAETKDGTAVREIWTAPLAGGDARMVATFTGEHKLMDSIALDGENVVWGEDGRELWTIPLTGGEPRKFATGASLIDWPWLSDVPAEMNSNQSTVKNIATGETREIKAPQGAIDLRCGPTWCVGRTNEGGFMQRVDGTGFRKSGDGFAFGLRPYPILDRFTGEANGAHDLATGTYVTWKRPGNSFGVGTSPEPSTIIYWDATKGDKPDEYRVVNLAAVPPAQ